jgi:hypothetical protein
MSWGTIAMGRPPLRAQQARAQAASLLLRLCAGALIPSFATIIFNILNFIFENYQKTPPQTMQDSVYEVGVGCAFSMIGVCVGSKSFQFINKFLVVFVFLLLFLLMGQLSALIWGWPRMLIMWSTNLVALAALIWAIVEAE